MADAKPVQSYQMHHKSVAEGLINSSVTNFNFTKSNNAKMTSQPELILQETRGKYLHYIFCPLLQYF